MDHNSLSGSLIRTVSDPSAWDVALAKICEATRTNKALISLRDPKTAEIVIPEHVSEDSAGPLIYGFSEAEVAAFLDHYAALDPWVAIERKHYPYYPYAISRHFPREELRQTAFWDWLRPQGIDDCIVCELGRSDTYWAALNLYFDAGDGTRIERVLDRVREVLPLVKSAWASGREFQLAKSAEGALEIVLTAVKSPSVLVNQDGVIVASNNAMRLLFTRFSGAMAPGMSLALPRNVSLSHDSPLIPVEIARTEPTDFQGRAVFSAFRSGELAGGETHDLYLLTIEPDDAGSRRKGQKIWEAKSLTDRERTLVRKVAQGMKFNDAHIEMGVSYGRVMQLWKSARTKLGIRDVNELRIKHELSQK